MLLVINFYKLHDVTKLSLNGKFNFIFKKIPTLTVRDRDREKMDWII